MIQSCGIFSFCSNTERWPFESLTAPMQTCTMDSSLLDRPAGNCARASCWRGGSFAKCLSPRRGLSNHGTSTPAGVRLWRDDMGMEDGNSLVGIARISGWRDAND